MTVLWDCQQRGSLCGQAVSTWLTALQQLSGEWKNTAKCLHPPSTPATTFYESGVSLRAKFHFPVDSGVSFLILVLLATLPSMWGILLALLHLSNWGLVKKTKNCRSYFPGDLFGNYDCSALIWGYHVIFIDMWGLSIDNVGWLWKIAKLLVMEDCEWVNSGINNLILWPNLWN